MCARCDTLAADLTAEVMLAAAERELILAQTDAGESVAHATRPLSAAEKRAKMRFGEIDKLESAAAEQAAKLLASNAQVYIMAVIGAIFGSQDAVEPAQVVDAVEQINRSQPDDVIAETERSQKAMSTILGQVYAGAAQIVIGEARRQGVKKTPKPFAPDPARFEAVGKAVALHPWTRLTSKLQADMLEPRTLAQPSIAKTDVQKNLEAIPLDGAVDLARQSIHTAHGQGRVEAAKTMAPEEIWASELLDGETCDECAKVDGKDYDTVEAAEIEYESGGYGACKGGARCRGTLVFQYNGLGTDAPQAKPAPEPEPEPAPAPKTPRKRKPATPKPAPAPSEPEAPAPPAPPLTRRQALELERQQAEQAKAKAKTPATKPAAKPAAKKKPAAPGLPPAPTGTPPKRRKGTVQRYETLDQLPIQTRPPLKEPSADYVRAAAAFTNPGYTASNGLDKNYSNNCSSVVQAYEFRRRGYDVRAAPVKAGRGRVDSEYIGAWWEDADGNPVKPTYMKDLPLPKAYANRPKTAPRGTTEFEKMQLDEYIEAMPDGARGFITLHWAKGGGHVFNFEKVHGKPVYLEGQTGNTDGDRHLAPGKFRPGSLRVTRIDDKIPTNAVTEAFETRPAELAEELATKKPTVAEMKRDSQYRVRTHPDGTQELLLPKYRMNPFTRKWEEVPPEVLKQAKDLFDESERKRLGK